MYHSTRNKNEKVSASAAILKGLADDGGLYVPEEIPKINIENLYAVSSDYKILASNILELFLDDFSKEQIKKCVQSAYTDKFDVSDICPVKKISDKYYLELFHGPTLAFKDLALSILPEIMSISAENLNIKEDILILTATSGDTGKAALEGFKDRKKTKIVVYYPSNGVSFMQKKQMLAQEGDNLYVYGIDGNFDDAQNAVKRAFSNIDFRNKMKKKGYILSSANSINIGRLIPQIVYYFYAYFKIVRYGDIKLGDKINIDVPTGNFGNILAAYYAMLMGLPVNKLICASNKNKVLTEFLSNGIYNRNRRFYKTISPSMDIIISSNFERMLYHATNGDTLAVKNYMKNLSEKGVYEVHLSVLANIDVFRGEYANETQTRLAIKNLFEKTGYIIDPHTAVALYAYDKYREKSKDKTVTMIVSTASPFKFPFDVLNSLGKINSIQDENQEDLLEKLSNLSMLKIPESLLKLQKMPNRFDKVINPEYIEDELLRLELLK